ncbi:MAG TPA: carboxymuconolactone decarboxylase family protein [Ktedonobacterales bacterium]|nr:carboxymuconolactone decarboxylase family protein [Ktedonobacterales bacterium]
MDPRMNYGKAAPGLMKAMGALEDYVDHCGLEPGLLDLIKLRASQINGCAYCVDMHYLDARANGETEQRLAAVVVWHEAPFFTERERAALRWAEVVNAIPARDPDDEEFRLLKAHFRDDEIAELCFVIVTIRAWNALNVSVRNPIPESA